MVRPREIELQSVGPGYRERCAVSWFGDWGSLNIQATEEVVGTTEWIRTTDPHHVKVVL